MAIDLPKAPELPKASTQLPKAPELPKAPTADNQPDISLENLKKEGLNNKIYPALYYSRSHSVTLGLAYYSQNKKENYKSPYAQLEIGIQSTAMRAGLAEYSPVGLSFSVGVVLLKMYAKKDNELFHRKGTYGGGGVSVMFGLAVVRLNYYRALEAKRTADGALDLSVGIGLF